MVDLTHDEQEYLVEVLRSAHTELLRDLHHADSRGFRQELKNVLELNERLTGKVNAGGPTAHEIAWIQRPAGV